MVAPLPLPKCRYGAGNAFLAYLHATTDSHILQIGRTDQVAASGDDPGSRATEELVTGIDHKIGAAGDEPREIIFRCGIDDDRHTGAPADFGEASERDLPIMDDVVRNHIERG